MATVDANQKMILLLAVTLYKLYKRSAGEWISTRTLAKHIEGSENYDFLVSSYARLPEARGLFALTYDDSKIRLTEEGIRFARTQSTELQRIKAQAPLTQQVADAVKTYASRLKRQHLNVLAVATLAKRNGRYIQAVQVAIEDDIIPTDTPVSLHRPPASTISGRIVGQEPDGGVLYIAFDSEVTNYDLPAKLGIDRAFLLHKLADSLVHLEGIPPLAAPLIQKNGKGFSVSEQNSVALADALATLRSPWTRFLWGPPGAGKTYALGRLVTQLLKKESDRRILLVAPSNLAVDVALEQLLSHIESSSSVSSLIQGRQILRYGYPRRSSILNKAEVLGPTEESDLTKEIKGISSRIADAEQKQAREEELSVLRAELLGAQEELRRLVSKHLENCRVVATTAAMAYLGSSPIPEMQFDSVLVDEVTMVPPATCLFLSSLAQERLLLAGDPRQLGPVYQETREDEKVVIEWMKNDVFEQAGLSHGRGEGREVVVKDSRLARITSQKRCTSQVWMPVQHLYPGVANGADEVANEQFRDLPPLPGKGMVVLDVGQSHGKAVCEKRYSSWQNPYTADLAIEVAGAITGDSASQAPSIAIIAPYRAHVKILKQRLREEKSANTPLGHNVEAGTIHQFQGSEADIVIFDLVDGEGRRKLGHLLCGDVGYRLVTVAITRARAKCIIIANKAWCQTHMERSDNPLIWDIIVPSSSVTHMPVLPPKAHVLQERTQTQTESPIEAMLLNAMRGYSELKEVQTQFRIYDQNGTIVSRADFAFPSVKYAVYCDGAQWHNRHDRWQRDLRQRNKLAELGWTFSVFSGSDVNRTPDKCAAQVRDTYATCLDKQR